MGIQLIRLSQIKSNLPEFIDFEQQLIAMFGDDDLERFIAKENQQTFTLSQSFPVGKNSLKVFVNGILQVEGPRDGFIEINPRTISFTEPLYKDDLVVVFHNRLKKYSQDMGKTRVAPYDIIRKTYFITSENYNQVVFEAPDFFQPGHNQIKVYANGVLLSLGENLDYIENSTTTIKLSKQWPINTTITLEVIKGGLSIYKSHRFDFAILDSSQGKERTLVLPQNYKVGANNLKVYLNGVLLRKGASNDYEEINSNTLRFNYDLLKNSKIIAEVIHFAVDVFTILRKEIIINDDNKDKLNFVTERPYIMGESNLRVYLNGILLREGQDEDYVEVNENEFKFNNENEIGSVIEYEIITW